MRLKTTRRSGDAVRSGRSATDAAPRGPLCQRTGVRFTPHMARHDFATALNEHDASPRDIVGASTWTSEKSVHRYTDVDMKRAREILARLPSVLGLHSSRSG